MREHEIEPIPGLPERPPEGEAILWQGSPRWWSLARRGFYVSTIAIYFGIAIAAVLVGELSLGTPVTGALASGLWLLVPAGLATGLLTLLAWLYARMTVYTITSERVVIRSGLALPSAINIPFERVVSAGIKHYRDDTGDLALRLDRENRASLVMLWPHVRPFQWSWPEPALRCIAGPQHVADLLGEALQQRLRRQSHPEAGSDDGSAADDQCSDGAAVA